MTAFRLQFSGEVKKTTCRDEGGKQGPAPVQRSTPPPASTTRPTPSTPPTSDMDGDPPF